MLATLIHIHVSCVLWVVSWHVTVCVCASSESRNAFSFLRNGINCVVDFKKSVLVSHYELGLNAEALIILARPRALSVVPHVMFQLLFISHTFTLLQ